MFKTLHDLLGLVNQFKGTGTWYKNSVKGVLMFRPSTLLTGCTKCILTCLMRIQNIEGATQSTFLSCMHGLNEKEGGFLLAIYQFGALPRSHIMKVPSTALRMFKMWRELLFVDLKCDIRCSIYIIRAGWTINIWKLFLLLLFACVKSSCQLTKVKRVWNMLREQLCVHSN
jgi:hypothetical protein